MATRTYSYVAFSYMSGVIRISHFGQFHVLKTMQEDKYEVFAFTQIVCQNYVGNSKK
jgi:hypothetical protein